MNPERWKKVSELFQAALDKDLPERDQFLLDACDDPAILNEVRSLLANYEDGFLEQTAEPGGTPSSVPEETSDSGKVRMVGRSFSHYRILDLLGAGGMGEVFIAEDTKLERKVAIKVLRADLTRETKRKRRFIQEARAAASIEHPHIADVYEVDDFEGRTFIAMEYVRGTSLREAINKGTLSLRQGLEISRQIIEALAKVHEHGLVHRDLKPENILVSEDGYAKIIDFGLAKLVEPLEPKADVDSQEETVSKSVFRSHTGDVVGTLSYMSPEQARGEHVDARSDVFSFGIVLHELVTGRHPFRGSSTLETLSNILRAPPAPLELDGSEVTPEIQRIISKSLNKKPDERYQNTKDMALDLTDALQSLVGSGTTHVSSLKRYIPFGLFAVLLLIGTLWLFFRSLTNPISRAGEPLSLLVADFDNRTDEPVFAGALEQAVTTGLEQAPFITCYKRPRARQQAGQLDPTAGGRLDGNLAALVSQKQGIELTMTGIIEEKDSEYTITITAFDSISSEAVAEASAEADSSTDVLDAARDLAGEIRRQLGVETLESSGGSTERSYSTRSLEALSHFAQGQEFFWLDNYDEALAEYEKALQKDSEYVSAYAGIAAVFAKRGESEKSKEYFEKALSRLDRTTERERQHIRAAFFLLLEDYSKAVVELEKLVELYPADLAGHVSLASAHFHLRHMKAALDEGRIAAQLYPDDTSRRWELARYAMYATGFDEAIRAAQRVLEFNPSHEKALVAKSLSELARGDTSQSFETYQLLETKSDWGISLTNAGLADLALTEGRLSDAALLLERGARRDLDMGYRDAAARKLAVLAQTLLAQGRAPLAWSAAQSALELERHVGVLFPVAMVFLGSNREDQALSLAKELSDIPSIEVRTYAKLIEGEVQLNRSNTRDALRIFQAAKKISDTWLGRFSLGRAYLQAGAFTEAHSELELCLKRRGEATALFLDEIPTYHYFPPVHYYFGRAQVGLNSPAASESFRTFLAIKGHGEENLIIEDARERLESLSR